MGCIFFCFKHAHIKQNIWDHIVQCVPKVERRGEKASVLVSLLILLDLLTLAKIHWYYYILIYCFYRSEMALMALHVFTYVSIFLQTPCTWMVYILTYFSCIVASSDLGMTIKGPQIDNGRKCRNIYTCHARKETFHKLLDCFSK